MPLSERLSPKTTIELYRPAVAGRLVSATSVRASVGSALARTVASINLRIRNSYPTPFTTWVP